MYRYENDGRSIDACFRPVRLFCRVLSNYYSMDDVCLKGEE
jgi:hypothetical protein